MAETVRYRRKRLDRCGAVPRLVRALPAAQVGCYCALIEPFESLPRFVILSSRARPSTGSAPADGALAGKLALVRGGGFLAASQVNREIADPGNAPMLLFRAAHAVNLSGITVTERNS